MRNNSIKNITLIFSENPVARAYLYLLIKKNLINNKIIYLDFKPFFWKFFCKLRFNSSFNKTLKYLKSKEILKFIKNIEKYFDLDDNFLIEMYKFENLSMFKDLKFSMNSDINNKENINYFKNLEETNFLNSSNIILKDIFDSNKNFFHIHPAYMYKIKGADGILNSIKHFNKIGASFFLMDKKIDNGKILKRYERDFNKINFPKNSQFNTLDLYNIWFSFFDPALRVFFLNKILNENISLNNFLNIDSNSEENNYYSFVEKKELRDLFTNLIFKNN